ncbi:MAG: hypothetical protein H7A35_12110 [Planctomycetales bacterium]|nr:hypothetical protein [bacterium]UNM07600.1 MAG: hypothetical protein H7A35_12110 [Planctomycetales bacterium]
MKAFVQAAKVLIVCGLIIMAAAIYSCTENSGGGKGQVSNAAGGSVNLIVSGETHPAGDVLTSPLMRTALREYCYSMTMLKKAREAKIEVTDDEVNAKIEETKKVVDQRNTTWEHYLESQYVTEEEYWLNAKYSIMFERLVDSRVVVSEDDKLELWDTQQASIIDQYLAENHLPESERSSVEYEKVESICEDRARNVRKQAALVDVRKEIVEQTTIEFPFIDDAEKRQLYEDLTINQARAAQEERGEQGAMPGTARQ